MAGEKVPIEADSIKDLNRIGGILALIFGIILIVVGIPFLLILIGIVFIVFGVIDILIWNNLKEINQLIDKGEYRRAKEKELTWMILGLILGGVIIGVILLIAYIKFDDLIRHTEG